MEGTSDFHNHVLNRNPAEPARVFDDATAFDARDDMLNADTQGRELAIEGFLGGRKRVSSWFFEGGQDLGIGQGKAEKAQVLQQPTASRQGIEIGIGQSFVMDAASTGVGEQENHHVAIDQEQILQGVRFFLATVASLLFRRTLGALNPSFGGVMTKRGSGASASGV